MSDQNYRSEIDGLRAVAVISVVAFHAFPENLSGGYVGVGHIFRHLWISYLFDHRKDRI